MISEHMELTEARTAQCFPGNKKVRQIYYRCKNWSLTSLSLSTTIMASTTIITEGLSCTRHCMMKNKTRPHPQGAPILKWA